MSNNKYQVDYIYCKECGIIQVEASYWLDKSYTNAIAAADAGLVSKNLNLLRMLTPIAFVDQENVVVRKL